MPSMKLLVMGRSGCGKDALRRALEARGFRFVKSATTRPPRTADEDTHVFVDNDEMARLLQEAVAATEIDGFHYCTTASELDASDAYIVDPEGLFELCEKAPDNAYRVVYVRAPRDARLQAAVARADDKQDALDRFELRDADEDERFSEFEKLLDAEHIELPDPVSAWEVIDNDYIPATLEERADAMVLERNFHENLLRLVELAVRESILPSKDGHVHLEMEDGTSRDVSLPRLADMLAGNKDDLAGLLRTVMCLVPLELSRKSANAVYNAVYAAEYGDEVCVESDVHIDTASMRIDLWGERRMPEDALDSLAETLVLESECVDLCGTLHTVCSEADYEDPSDAADVIGNGIVWRD